MEPLTLDALRTMAKTQGLDLTDDELRGLLPLIQAGRAMMEPLSAVPRDLEPTVHYGSV